MAKRELTAQEIEQLASRPGVRRIAVENFLGTMGTDLTRGEQLANLTLDTALYKWNAATQKAISVGIGIAYGKK